MTPDLLASPWAARLGHEAALLAVLLAGLFGAVLGSFLNVCILCWGAEPKESVLRPRSRCPKCGTQIRWYDNVPVVSWLALGARCRQCRQPISAMYPLVELAVALIWAGFVWRHGLTLEAARGALFFTLLLAIAVTDFRAYIIPDEFSLGGLAIGLAFAAAGGWETLRPALVGAATGFALLWLVGVAGAAVFKQEAMGGGDVKMMAMVGAFLGWQGTLLTVFLGALVGSLIFVPMQLLGQKRLVPFGIFLALGAATCWFAGAPLVDWYLRVSGLR